VFRALGCTAWLCQFSWCRMLNLCERTPFNWVTARQTRGPMQPAPLVLFFRAPVLPCLHAIASDLFRSATRHEDKPPSNQTTEFTEEHRGISQNRLRTPLWTPCTLWFSPSLDQSSTTNRARQPLRLFARTGRSDSHAPSAMPINLAKY
jgi:hypothetical protein